MTTAAEFDVVIAGAGIVGSAAACLFARAGLRVALVEARAVTATDDSRVSAIGLAAGNLLRALEVWSAVGDDAKCAYRAMQVWDDDSAARISFAAADLGEPCLGYIVENRALLAAMLDKLRANYQVTIIDETEIVGVERGAGDARIGVTVTDDDTAKTTREIRARLLIGADGGRSRVRELCGIKTERANFGQDAIVSRVTVAGAHRDTAWQCFAETGPAALLPLADGRCALVWSCERALADEIMALDDAEFCARLQAIFGDQLGDISACDARQKFVLTRHHATTYIADSVALIGDAAHLVHPLAGLGANLGLLDAAALAEVVAHANSTGKDIGQRSVLRRYERWRKGDNAVAQVMMTGFKEIFGSDKTVARKIRSAGLNFADSVAPIKNILAKYATGLYGDLPAICRRA